MLYPQKRFDEAEALFKLSLEVLESAWGALNPSLAVWLDHYSDVLRRNQQYGEAEQVRLQAVRIHVTEILRPR